jgi:hypothetical protein
MPLAYCRPRYRVGRRRLSFRQKLGADSGVVVDQMRDERRAPIFATEFKPSDHGRRGALSIAINAVSPESLARSDVGKSVAIHIPHPESVRLRKPDSRFTRVCGSPHDEVSRPALRALLELGETVSMRIEARDHVG